MKQIVSSKRSQFQISFGMIFSIILIIAFIAVAIYAMIKFLEIGKCSEIGLFKENLQDEINTAWASDEVSGKVKGSLPLAIEEVCFIDSSNSYDRKYEEAGRYLSTDDNMFFYPLEKSCEGLKSFYLKHINIKKITEAKNPYCVKNSGTIELKIEKKFDDSLVGLS